MSAKSPFRMITPPESICDKVTVGSGPSIATIVARAQAAVDSLRSDYAMNVRHELAELDATIVAARHCSAEERPALITRMYKASHELRGQGTTFDYPLVTKVATSLCKLLDEGGDQALSHVASIQAHIDAMKLIITRQITGDGGVFGKELSSGIDAVLAKVLRKLQEGAAGK